MNEVGQTANLMEISKNFDQLNDRIIGQPMILVEL